MPDTDAEDLLRRLAPQVLGAVVRRYGHFDTAEDNPRAWLITVASRRLTDLLRSEQARQRREGTVAQWTLPVLHVLYLIFNEGYASTSGRPNLHRAELSTEAIRLYARSTGCCPTTPRWRGCSR